MKGRKDWRNGVVTRAQPIARGVRLIEFVVEGDVPAFDPGSHVEIEVQAGHGRTTRSYTCVPAPLGHVRVAVKEHANSRGGSRFMWSLIEGAKVRLTAPENRFELSWRAPAYLLVAGGIGITPIYGMAQALARRDAPLRLAYGARSRAEMVFANDLADLLGARAELFPGDEGRRIDLAAEIAALPEDGELYICGPLSMLNEAKALWTAAGRPVSRFRFEVFGDTGDKAETAFSVDVVNQGVHVEVAADQSLLDALTAAGVDMIWDCQRGECGLCAVDVVELEGEIDHRDVFFSAEEKRQQRRMCSCVSRITGGRAVIDIGYRT